MDIDKWEQLKEELGRKFQVLEEAAEDLTVATSDGEVLNGKADVVIFETPIGRVKLAFESHPVVLGKKEIYSHQQGKAARTEYQFSDTEFSHKLKAYKWDDVDDDWKEIDAGNFS
ncbi:MAG TPA: hypothetical protein VFX17_03265 [Patescibacteria group bacterium]|nr:hypothetical protein [Patescibacteria group bacterium]